METKSNSKHKPTLVLPTGRLYLQLMEFIKTPLPAPATRQYFFDDVFDDCNIFFAKPRSIPQLLQSKLCEFGFVGKDVMEDSLIDCVDELYDTGLNPVDVVLAINKDYKIPTNKPAIVASEYENIASDYFTKKGTPHYILKTGGSTEGYIKIGANYVIDITETGETLKANNLTIIDTLFRSTTRLYAHKDLCDCVLPEIIQKIIK